MSRSRLSAVVDGALEATVVGSFSRAGYAVRSRLEHWRPPAGLAGRVVVVTGASSGIGQAAAVGSGAARRHALAGRPGPGPDRGHGTPGP